MRTHHCNTLIFIWMLSYTEQYGCTTPSSKLHSTLTPLIHTTKNALASTVGNDLVPIEYSPIDGTYPINSPVKPPTTPFILNPTNRPTREPSESPTMPPTVSPTNGPTRIPSGTPTSKPSGQPTGQPSEKPTTQPTAEPSSPPTWFPTGEPSGGPSGLPTCEPSGQPTEQPSVEPSAKPSHVPTGQPSEKPTGQPSVQPSGKPSAAPSGQPTFEPSCQPTSVPTREPTGQPSSEPSRKPTSYPSGQPSREPTGEPSVQPSTEPTGQPTVTPTSQPSQEPTGQPTGEPSGQPTGQPSGEPSGQPSGQPTSQPSAEPTGQPSSQPSREPTEQPTGQPSGEPTGQPTGQPSGQPTGQPSGEPTGQPTGQPSGEPSGQPSGQPSGEPTGQPTGHPTGNPSGKPTSQPTGQPIGEPTGQPTGQPSGQPTGQPSGEPTGQPTGQPSEEPSGQPSGQPSGEPTGHPTGNPSGKPTSQPTGEPSGQPTGQPSVEPTGQPTDKPSRQPTGHPSGEPSVQPTSQPSAEPTGQPSSQPSREPTGQPTGNPSGKPTGQPTGEPSGQPTGHPSGEPSGLPSVQPSGEPTGQPSGEPSSQPSLEPTGQPTGNPTGEPTGQPTGQPSGLPSAQPSGEPTGQPTSQPSVEPTGQPSGQPSREPTGQPTGQPSGEPTGHPTGEPTEQPSGEPTGQPTGEPSGQPSGNPTGRPTGEPTGQPTGHPSGEPTVQPTSQPSAEPTGHPSSQPSREPTGQPTGNPSGKPTGQPTGEPSGQPTGHPSGEPSGLPSVQHSGEPTGQPSGEPSSQPSLEPTGQPTGNPTGEPTGQPTGQPSGLPSAQPSGEPTGQPTSQPSVEPTGQPSGQPSREPTGQPTGQPSGEPTGHPTGEPTEQPSGEPTGQPTGEPSGQPSGNPTGRPTGEPTGQPTGHPSGEPTVQPTSQPSAEPTGHPSSQPSREPTGQPTGNPSGKPTGQPTGEPSGQPTGHPSGEPSGLPSVQPSGEPTGQPSGEPSSQPSLEPTGQPTGNPTGEPTGQPTGQPSGLPSAQPSGEPTGQPTSQPSVEPTGQPSGQPSREPTGQPTGQPSGEPTGHPTGEPTEQPSGEPTGQPTGEPSGEPTGQPSGQPSGQPTSKPSAEPTGQPTREPSGQPSGKPTGHPSGQPSGEPTGKPSGQPSGQPTAEPSGEPTGQPTNKPSCQPSGEPTGRPTGEPSGQPTGQPSGEPTGQPTGEPSALPSARPSGQPTSKPTGQPSGEPTGQPTSQPSIEPTGQPTGQPSSQPSGEPTGQPTGEPSGQPTRLPTSSPTNIPTKVPTSFPTYRPTCAPVPTVTHYPTLPPTLSMSPTLVPSLSPSISFMTLWKEKYDAYINGIDLGARSTFASLVVKGERGYGTCGEWEVFVNDDIATALITYTASTLSMISTVDYSADLESVTVTCNDSATAADIVTTLMSVSKATVSSSISFKCHDTSWMVGRCGSLTSAFLCANCTASPCTPSTVKPSAIIYDSPCNEVETPLFPTILNILQIEFTELSVASDILSVTVSSTTNSITATVAVDVPEGSLVCSAYLASDSFVPSTVDTLLLRNDLISITSTTVSFIIEGLIASSDYDVYCATYSALDTPMDYDLMRGTKSAARTACCRTLKVELIATSYSSGEDTAVALKLDAGDVVPNDLNVSLAAFQNSTVYPFVPSSVVFTSSTVEYVAYIRQNAGVYNLAFTMSGLSANDYVISYTPASFITVLAADTEPAVPVLMSATFSNDGTKITLLFDAPTNRAGYTNNFNCIDVFSFPGIQKDTRCLWVDDSRVSIYPGASGVVGVSDVITLQANKIRAKCKVLNNGPACSTWQFNSLTSIRIHAPQTPLVPTLSIISPSQIGPCDSLPLDISGSKGSGGRSFVNVSFNVYGIHENVSLVTTYLNANYEASGVLTVPQALLYPGFAYSITVVMCNFIGGCGRSTHSFVVSSSENVPVVSLNSKKLRLQYRYSSLSVTGQAYTSVCGGATSTANMQYSWKIFAQGAPLSLVSQSSDPRTFKLLPYTLEVGTVYTVTLTAQHTESLKYSSASVSVTVVKGLVVAKVSGSSSRGVRTDSSVNVDASGSYDEDNNEATGVGAGLSFAFSCAQTYPSYKANSDLVISAISPSQVSVSVPQNSSDERIDSVHQLTVKVVHTKDFRSSTATVIITVLPSLAPLVTLLSSSGTRINPSQKFKLLATVEVAAGGTATWSVDDPSIHLQSVSLSEVTKAIATPASSREVYTLSLVLPPNTLPQESKFSFQLACSLDTGYSATAAITISTNSPPYPGSYSVSPSTGTMLVTEFTFSASKWEDSDIPLSYEFAYQGSSGAYLVHRSRLELSYVSTDLPAGKDSADFMLSTRLQVFDILDAKIASYSSVEVKMQELSAEDKQNYLTDALANSNGYADEMKKAIATTASILNSVNCSSAPNCTILNRFDCTTTASTCGECLEGYAGESGHANTYCLHLSDDTRRRLSMGSSNPTSCTRNSDCDSTQWEVCDSNVCVVMPKDCPGDCSYSGYCQYVSVYDANVTYTTCNVLSVHCKAICACYDGFTGHSCEYSVDEFNQTLQTRHQLAEAIRSVSLLEDPSADTLVSWIEGLASICSDPSGIEDKTKDLVASMAVEFIADAVDLGLSYEDITAVSTVLDLVLDADPSVGGTSFVLYQAYYDFILLDMVEGQNSIDVVNNLFRFSCLSLDGRRNSTVTSPRTILEDLVGSSSQTAVVPQSAYQTAFKVAVVESLVSHFSNDTYTLSVPFGLRFDESPCNTSSFDACNVTVVLQNVKSIPENHVSDGSDIDTLYLDCEKGELISQEYECPAGDIITLSCNGSSSGTVSRSCPVHDFSVTCDVIGDDSVSCSLIEYTGSNITCECTLPLERQRRRMQESESSDDSAVSVDFASVSRSILIEFVDTWTSVDDLSGHDVVGSIRVLLTVGFIGLFGIFSVVGAYHLDNHDKATEKDSMKSIERENIHKMSSLLSRSNRVTPSSSRSGRQLITKPTSLTDAIMARVFRSVSNATVQPQVGRAKLAQVRVQNSGSSKDVQMIEDALPMVLRRVPLWKKVSNEVQIYHRWIGVVCHYSPTYSRPIRIMSLLMNILTMLFIEAITYDIADPDDGSCETYTNSEECLKEKSSLSRSESKCYWDAAEDSCYIRPISNDLERVLMVALFAAVISTPIAISFQSLIMFILSAETRQEGISKRRRQLSRVSSLERGDSCDSAHIESSTSYNGTVPKVEISGYVCDSTLHEDFARLLNDIRRFRSTLTDSEREEFDCVWGEELTADVKNSMILKLTKLFFCFTGHSENSGQAMILSELSNVRKLVQRESLYFGNISINRENKNKRLVYLFIKDLMDSANGQILDAKDRRDSAPKRRATLFAKVCTWIFLTVVAAAMLLYIYLFAMRQTETRQKAWFYSFVVWLIFNITLVCTGMVIIQHIAIPFMTMKDVIKIKKKVTHDIVSFKQNSKNCTSLLSPSDDEFNAARYLYPSVRLASLYPNLPESRLIMQYSTPWPKKSVKTKARSMERNYDTKFQFLTQAFSRVLLFAVTSMIELPEPIQDMALEIVSTFGLGYIVVLHVQLFRLNPVLAFVPCVTVAIVLHFLTISGRGSTRLDFAGSLPSSESISSRLVHPAKTENDFEGTREVSNISTVQKEPRPPSNPVTTRMPRCSSLSTCEDECTGYMRIVVGDDHAHVHSSECSAAPSDIRAVQDGHVSWEDSDEYDPDSICMLQNGLRWPGAVDGSDFDDRIMSEWLQKLLHVRSSREIQESHKQVGMSTHCVRGSNAGEFTYDHGKIDFDGSNYPSGEFVNQRPVTDAWVLGKDAIATIDSYSNSGENATVATENESEVEGFRDVMADLQWEDDDFLCHVSQHVVAVDSHCESDDN